MSEPENPLDENASLTSLLSVSANPLLINMPHDELTRLVIKLRQITNSPPTLSAAIANDGERARGTGAAAKRKQILDNL